jgi:NAD+ diphosphatase
VLEEVGIAVANVEYFASQPWPFPNSLMIAFFCDYAGGEIRPQETEIEAAEWFDIFQLPKLPSKISIARRLIDAATEKMRAGVKRDT